MKITGRFALRILVIFCLTVCITAVVRAKTPIRMARSGQAASKPGLPFEGGPRLTIYWNVACGRAFPDIQKLDTYIVKSATPTPVLIAGHGGGWRRGQKSQFMYGGDLMDKVIRAGIPLVSNDYRLTPRHQFQAQAEDMGRAVQFARSKAKEWNLAPDRIVSMGGSAGGNLSASVALPNNMVQLISPDPVRLQSSLLGGAVMEYLQKRLFPPQGGR